MQICERKKAENIHYPHQMTMFVLWQRLKIQTQIFVHTFNINDLRKDHVLRLTHSIRYHIELRFKSGLGSNLIRQDV